MSRSAATAVAVSALACYGTSLPGDLVYDDLAAVVANRDLRPFTPITDIFFNDFWGTPIRKESSHKSYRPLCVLSFRLNYALHGLHPLGYHALNIALHLLVSLLYYRLCQYLVPARTCLVAALLFAVHPIHTDAVASVVGRAELLSAICYLCALLSCLRCSSGVSAYLLPPFFSVCGLLCKEQALTALPLCCLFLLWTKGPPSMPWSWLRSNWCQQGSSSPEPRCRTSSTIPITTRKVIFWTATFCVAAAIRMAVTGSPLPAFSRLEIPAHSSPTPTRHLTYGFLASLNAWLLAFPSSLSCDWTMGSIQLVASLSDPRNLATLATASTLVVLVAAGLYQKHARCREGTSTLISISLTVVPFLPASNMFFPVGFVIAERVLYLPSMGFSLLVAIGFSKLHKTYRSRRNYLQGALVLLLFSHAAKTAIRNKDWRSELALFGSGVRTNPRNAKLLNNFGLALERSGNKTEALLHYRRAILLQPDDARGYLNAGKLLSNLGNQAEAEAVIRQAQDLIMGDGPFSLTPSELQVFVQLAAVVARNTSRLLEAEQIVQQAIDLRSDFSAAYVQRGELLLKMNKTQDAAEMFQQAISRDHNNPDLLNNYGVLLLEGGRNQEALQIFTRALHLDPELEATHLNLALLIQETGSGETRNAAIERLHEVVSGGRRNESVYFRLGMLALQERRDVVSAEHWFRQAVMVQPTFGSALFNLAKLLSEQNRSREAVPVLRTLLKHHPNHIRGLMLMGEMYVHSLRDLDAAEEVYRKLLELEPGHAQGLHNLCVVALERGDLRGAEHCFHEAAARHPSVEYIQRHLQVTRDLLARTLSVR